MIITKSKLKILLNHLRSLRMKTLADFCKLQNPTEAEWLLVIPMLEGKIDSVINTFFKTLPPSLKNEIFYLKAIKEHTLFFKYLINNDKTNLEFTKKALSANGQVLGLIDEKDQNLDFVKLAMDECISSIGHAKINLPEEFYLRAIDDDPTLIEAVPDDLKTKEMCLKAVKADGSCLRFICEQLQTPEICLAAIKQDKRAIKMVEILSNIPHDQIEQTLIKTIEVKNNKQIIKQTIGEIQ